MSRFRPARPRVVRTVPAAALAGVLATGVALASSAGAQAVADGRPTLVVFITIDQMRPDYFTRFGTQLTGGLKRLYDGGAVFTNGTYDHAITETAPAFVAMAHRIVWATVATVDAHGRPWTRILHPLWVWDGDGLTGWIATDPTGFEARHLAAHPEVALTY